MNTNNLPVPKPVRDSPSQRVTMPYQPIPDDEGDRNDGENWFENNVERGIEKLPAGEPLKIESPGK